MTTRIAALFVALWTAGSLCGQTQPETAPPPTPVPDPAAPTAATPLSPELASAVYQSECPNSNEWVWLRGDYLVGWLRGMHVPPLVTTSPTGTAQTDAGVLGVKGTTVLFGDDQVNNSARSGFRLGMGTWIDAERIYGIDIGGFWLAGQTTPFSQTSSGDPILARPFFDTIANTQNSLLIAFPGISNGTVTANVSSHYLASVHAYLSENVYAGPRFRLDAFGGYRHLRFDDQLDIEHSFFPNGTALAGGGNPFAPGTQITAADHFSTLNEFHGGEIGLHAQVFLERWTLDLLGKVAVGNLYRNVTIAGTSTVSVPGVDPVNSQGGLLALPSNIGSFFSNECVLAPELDLNLGWDITTWCRVRFGYTLLVLTGVARAGDQIDLHVNPNMVAPVVPGGPNQPQFSLSTTNLWVQAVNVGLEFRY
jgi:hypothetical protein